MKCEIFFFIVGYKRNMPINSWNYLFPLFYYDKFPQGYIMENNLENDTWKCVCVCIKFFFQISFLQLFTEDSRTEQAMTMIECLQ